MEGDAAAARSCERDARVGRTWPVPTRCCEDRDASRATLGGLGRCWFVVVERLTSVCRKAGSGHWCCTKAGQVEGGQGGRTWRWIFVTVTRGSVGTVSIR